MRWLFWWRPPCLQRECIVNLRHDATAAIQGVLWQSRGAWLIVKSPKALRAGAPPQPMDGDAVIHRDQVSFIQVLPS